MQLFPNKKIPKVKKMLKIYKEKTAMAKHVTNFTEFLSRMNQDAGTNARLENLAWNIWTQSICNAKDPRKPSLAECMKDLSDQIDEADVENPQGGVESFLKKAWGEARKEEKESMQDNEARFNKFMQENRP
jgi:hypothetical protein